MENPSGNLTFISYSIIDCPAEVLDVIFQDLDHRVEWEPMFDKNVVIEDYG